ncbi:zinc carboxypeptidase, putative, partial [Eimeria tenella]
SWGFAFVGRAVYELTEAFWSAATLNSEKVLNRICRSAAPWDRPAADTPQPLYRSWTKNQNEIYETFSPQERQQLEFIRYKIPPETPSGDLCILMLGEFDKEWTEPVQQADPPLPPQSWLARSRKEELEVAAAKGAAVLKGSKHW